ncbi:MAG: SHOCT domain-containing protein [Vicingaceae bacterium]
MEILKRRYAEGGINEEEYERCKKSLNNGGSGSNKNKE